MRYRRLGNTDFRVSEIGFGGWAIGGSAHGNSYGSTDDAVSLAALNRAYELGCNFFDTADLFGQGQSEELIGRALKGWNREEVVIATKGGHEFGEEWVAGGIKPNFSDAHLRRSVENSLGRLGVEAIDVYLLHTPPLALIQHEKVFEVLRELKADGKIRAYGVAIHDPQEGIQAIRRGQVDVIQAIYNLFDTRIEKGLIELCRETGTGLIAREPLARGFLAGGFTPNMTFEKGDVRAVWPKPLINKRIEAANRFLPLLPPDYTSLAQLALAFTLAEPTVACTIPGCKTPEQVEINMRAGELPPLPPETLEAIRQVQGAL